MPDISIAVISYKPIWDKLRSTLKSILCQKNVDFEIIIADDGSEDDCFDKVEKYLKAHNYSAYKLVKNPVNQGIVKNILSAINVAKGKYIKPISPGDFFYDEITLKSICDVINITKASVYFGRMIYYTENEGTVITDISKMNPFDVRPYINQDYSKIIKNYFLNNDFISGASVVYKTSIIKKYLSETSSFLKYAEDLSIMYMLLNGEKIQYISLQPIIWYEYGIGISTNINKEWNKKLSTDIKNMISFLFEKKLIKQWIKNLYFAKTTNIRRLIKFVHVPVMFLRHMIRKKNLKGYEEVDIKIDNLNILLQNNEK